MKIHFGHLLGAAALAVAGCAAFFSVFGLSQLFAGASLAVIIMASALEFSKLVSASFLHKYWSSMSKSLKIYLTMGVIVLVTITSAGIYGFLSSAYQKTAANLEVHNGELGVLDSKITQFKTKIESNEKLIENRNKRIQQLNDLRSGQESRLNSTTRSSAAATRKDITSANNEIKELTIKVDEITIENNKLMDSIAKYNVSKLDKTSKSSVAAEVGPLKYLAELTGKPMDEVVNYFILLLVFVFDPLAISLVIATTWVFERERLKKLNDGISDGVNQNIEGVSIPEYEPIFRPSWPEAKLEIIDEEKNLNDIEVFDVEEVNPIMEIDEQIQETIEDVDIHVESIDEAHESEEIHQEKIIPTTITPTPIKKIEKEDIKEIKEMNRNFSVKVPNPNNGIERIR